MFLKTISLFLFKDPWHDVKMSDLDMGIIALVALFTSVLSGVAGMGGGITLLAAMTFVVPLPALVPLHGTTQLISNLSRVLMLLKYIHKKIFFFFCLGLPIGVIVATQLIVNLSSKTLPLVLLFVLISYALFKPKKLPPLKLPFSAFFFVGVIAGLLGILVGATGPFLAVFFLRKDLKKEEIVGTKAILQMSVHFLKIPAYLYLGFNYHDYTILILVLAVASLLGTKLGVHLLYRVKEEVFHLLYRIALLAALFRLGYMIVN